MVHSGVVRKVSHIPIFGSHSYQKNNNDENLKVFLVWKYLVYRNKILSKKYSQYSNDIPEISSHATEFGVVPCANDTLVVENRYTSRWQSRIAVYIVILTVVSAFGRNHFKQLQLSVHRMKSDSSIFVAKEFAT